VLFLQQHFPEKVCRGFPIKAILLPILTDRQETRIRGVTAGEVLMALAPSTLFQLPGANTGAIKTMSKLAHRVPGYVLELGTDIAKIPEPILGLLTNG
jgi:hypothetical protein